jgi:purine-binding chemotaxis protein CheW
MAAPHEAPGIPVIELARPLAQEPDERYLLVHVTGAGYGIPVEQLAGVERVGQISAVPHAPPWLWGLTHLHRQVLPVVDLAAFLGLGTTSRDGTARLVVARHGDESYAFAVQSTRQIMRVRPAQVRAAGEHLAGVHAVHIRGVWLPEGQPAVPLLDLTQVVRAVEAWFRAEGWNDEDDLASGT